MSFADRATVILKGGSGGAGVAGFLRQKGRPRGKPTGGSGGDGGDVILRASSGKASLLEYDRQSHWSAESGTHGEGDLRHGKKGVDLYLDVPLGTVVHDADGTVIADLVEEGQQVLAARGGKGGRGNAAFVTKARRAPPFAEQGEFGEAVTLTLELRLIADAALIGFPNAGKSTLISRLSAARPKIADYPFTTLAPNLGVVEVGDRQFVLADIPGLVEGAAEGKGLGHDFLRHVERAGALVFLLDPTEAQEMSFRDQLAVLERELAEHSERLARVPRVVAVNKIDIVGDTAQIAHWAAARDIDVHLVSAATGSGLAELAHAMADLVDQVKRTAPDRPGFVLHRPLRADYAITREGDEWRVEGRAAMRAIRFADLTIPEAADFAARRLATLGVDEALRSAGAIAGDDVRIGELVFTFDPDRASDPEDAEGESADDEVASP